MSSVAEAGIGLVMTDVVLTGVIVTVVFCLGQRPNSHLTKTQSRPGRLHGVYTGWRHGCIRKRLACVRLQVPAAR